MLYPNELQAPGPYSNAGTESCRINLTKENGRGSRIRTYDPLLPKQMRYQTAPCPDGLLILLLLQDSKLP